MSSPRHKNNTKYTPDSTEIRNIIDEYIEESNRNGTSLGYQVVGIDNIGDLHAYIMEAKPSWNVPEKRRLQKFIKRAISHQSPSTPSSQQSEFTSDSTNNEMDNRSERSRSSRFKGITNRLFGGSNSPRKAKSETVQPPLLEIQTTMKTDVKVTEDLFTEPTSTTLHSEGAKEIRDIRAVLTIKPNAGTGMSKLPQSTADQSITGVLTNETSRDLDDIYADNNDEKNVKSERCCFLWFC